MKSHASIVLISFLSTLSGCSEPEPSGDRQPACGEGFAACGGSVVGTWEFTDTCVVLDAKPIDDCPGHTASASASVSGTLTLNDDQFFDLQRAFTVNFETFVPYACLEGLAPTCGSLGAERVQRECMCSVLAREFDSCDAEEGGCNCTNTRKGESDQFADYTVEGTTLTLVAGGVGGDDEERDGREPESSTFEYCVDGNDLYLHMMPGEAGTEAFLRLEKR